MKKALLFSSLVALSACVSENQADQDVTVIVGDIITMDATRPRASVMILKDGNISAVGDRTLMNDISSAKLIDLSGQTILPGFIDSHVHVRELGMDRIKANLVGVETAEDIVERLEAHFPNPKAGVWLIGQGWDEGEFATRGYPDRAALDAAFPNNPVALESLHGFGGFYNGKALEIAGIDSNTAEPKVGNILRREDGTPTGVMLTLAQDLVDQHIPKADQAKLELAIRAGLTEMSEAGVTSIHEAGMTPVDVAAFKALAARDELPIRVYGLLDGNDNTLMEAWFSNGLEDDPEDWLDIRGIKVFYDGSLGSRTALMAEPYSDKPDAARPTERISPEAMTSLANRAAKLGFQMAVHAIGDEGNNRTLNIYEEALGDDMTARWRIEHAQVVLPDYYDRVATRGVLSSVQSSHAVGDSGWAEDRVGPERIKNAYAWQTILGAGGRLMLNSDLPGEPWTPMETLYFAVTRKKLENAPAEGWYSNQALTVQEALEAMTITNAYGAFQEDALGSLEVGKRADFVVLDADPTKVAPTDIKDIRVRQTWVNGQPVYQAD
ncbi:amidohydrolase [Litorimonas cladophorae]|uniref:Amidohydrolase n=1 Tax=Litorimonas cladophorae TaxID=1220491 RepID=A0A918KCC6_9PROT|nr:amidohydrolase [Litorimonas cladophorae]GGX58580.1 amidohydrolase [Litorimonas cladophorae]